MKDILPLLEESLYDQLPKVREASVKQVVKIVELLTPNDWGDHILKFILKLSHEYDSEIHWNQALELLNKLAPSLDNQIVEVFIVPEIKSLAIDESSSVWKSLASNLSKILPKIWKEIFSAEIFPIL